LADSLTRFAAALVAFGLLIAPADHAAQAESPAIGLVHRLPEVPDDPPPSPSTAPVVHSVSPAASPARGGFVSVQVNIDQLGNNIIGDAANEPSIAVDPTNPNNVVIAWRQFDTVSSNFRQAGRAYSHDGGVTWTFPGPLQPGVFRSDPVLGADSEGNFYYCSLTTIGIFNQTFQVDFFKSVDGGVTWQTPVNAFGGDKQWFTIDPTAGIGGGHIYHNWNFQFSCCGDTDFTRSTNAGTSFQPSIEMPAPKQKWGTLSVGPDGTLYTAGARADPFLQTGHVMTRSTNAQNAVQTPFFELTKLVQLGGNTVTGGINPAGLLGQVWIATDHSSGPTQGNVYILGSVNRGGDPVDVMFIRSTDRGATWSTPKRVNDDPITSASWQWFGTMSVAPNGRIDVIWNDTRNDPAATTSELFYSFSLDAGVTWRQNLPLSPPFNHSLGYPNQNKLGDYYDMVSTDKQAYLAYAATFNGEQDVYFLAIMPDCNENGLHDGTDILNGTSTDCNENLIPDDCEPGCGLRFFFPNGLPQAITPGAALGIDVQIIANLETVLSGSAQLHYSFDGGAFQTATMFSVGNDLFLAALPPANCGDVAEFYFTAEGSETGAVSSPPDAPATVFSAPVGTLLDASFADDFSADQTWTVTGNLFGGGWERGTPVDGGRGDPPLDFDGSGQAFLTENAAGNSDVDGGPTILTSPRFDGIGCQRIFYAYWLNDIPAFPMGEEDFLTVEVSTDPNNADWQVVRTYNTPVPNWRTDTIEIGTEVSASFTMRIRFTVRDASPGNVVEAGIDAVRVSALECGQQLVCCAVGIFPDEDEDQVCDVVDNCLGLQNADQRDADSDGIGDDCDECTDVDFDGLGNGTNGNAGCPDGVAVDCDDTAGNASDADGDNVCDPFDQCPATAPGDPVDSAGCSTVDDDGDGVSNDLDLCPSTIPCASPVDPDGCAIDSDGDGRFDGCDNCPTAFNPNQADGDGNGLGDACDSLLALAECPADITVAATSEQGIIVAFQTPTAVNGFGTVAISADPPAGSVFPIGTTVVIVQATDDTGTTVTCTFEVTVLPPDGTPPGQTPPEMEDCSFGNGAGAVMMMPMFLFGWGLLRRRERHRR
jgi:hypothetical protein